MVAMNRDARIIDLNGEHNTHRVKGCFGSSVAHWEGNTLVAETLYFPTASTNCRTINCNVATAFSSISSPCALNALL